MSEATTSTETEARPQLCVRIDPALATELRLRSAISREPQCSIVSRALRALFAAEDAALSLENEAAE